jgi:hypothetical protein
MGSTTSHSATRHSAGKVQPAGGGGTPFSENLLQLDANFAEAHYQLGVLLEQNNKTKQAMEELNHAGILAPAYPQPITRSHEFTGAGKKQKVERELEIFQTLNAKVHPPRVQ